MSGIPTKGTSMTAMPKVVAGRKSPCAVRAKTHRAIRSAGTTTASAIVTNRTSWGEGATGSGTPFQRATVNPPTLSVSLGTRQRGSTRIIG
ncbi:MAG: hypothetical protein ACO1SV_14560 [Fimbriimonas sp.]